MTVGVLSLVEFLLARIAEDERAVEKLSVTDRRPVLSLASTVNHPERLLLECEAKRRIVADHEMTEICREPDRGKVLGYWWDAYCRRCTMDGEYTDITKSPSERPCPTLRALASVYRDHEEFDESWAL